MRPASLPVLALLTGGPGALAVFVTDGSPCTTSCGNVLDLTTTADIVCKDDEYATSDAGQVFQQCTECEVSSSYHQGDNNTDMGAALYNMRFTLSHCFFGISSDDKLEDNPCLTRTSCGDYKNGTEYKNLTLDVGPYDYCDEWPTYEADVLNNCRDCLDTFGRPYLSNFITTLQGGCEQKPPAGVSVGISGDIFSDVNVTITSPTPHVSVDPSWFEQGPITTGAITGIVAGGIVVSLIIAGCFIVWRGKRRRRAFLAAYNSKSLASTTGKNPRGKGWPSPIQVHGMSDTPLSQRPLRTWDDSPQSAFSDQQFPRYVSPYASQYTSPVSATDNNPMYNWPVMGEYHDQTHGGVVPQPAPAVQHHQEQQPGMRNIGLAIGATSPVEGDAAGESYELRNVEGRGASQQGRPHARTASSGSFRNFSRLSTDGA